MEKIKEARKYKKFLSDHRVQRLHIDSSYDTIIEYDRWLQLCVLAYKT